jgi:hypothetical protein
MHDGVITVAEAELFRAVADLLDCPLPPFLSMPVQVGNGATEVVREPSAMAATA